MRQLLSFVGIVAFATSCVSTNAIVLGAASTQRARVLPANVRVFRTPDQVKAKYEEVAMLNSKGESNWTNEKGMIESMQRKAGELGANGIILDAINEASAGAKVAGAIFGTGSQRKGRSVAIFVFPASLQK